MISTTNPRNRTGFGPPPYRYWRILGDVVTDEMRALEWNLDTPAPMDWVFIGPRPVSNEYWSGTNNAGGRVVSIACHPSLAGTAYAASASGGIWKTTDTGANWTPVTDGSANLNHGVVTLDAAFPDAVYAGTGEYTTGSTGGGLLRSLDGGTTWSTVAGNATLGPTCSGLAVVPGKSAASPAAIHWTGDNGYKRSVNGGASWTTPVAGSCSSLVVDPVNTQRIFVAVRGGGIRRSLNGGSTFTTLAGGLPTTGFDRIVMAQCRGTPDVLYAAFASGGNVAGFYRTADGGETWTLLSATPNFAAPQAWYDLSVGVDPTNPNRVFCGGVSPLYATAGVIESSNGGQTWTEISGSGGQIHPDQHAIAFGADNTPWFGCDGGVWRRVGSTWSNRNATLAAIQNYTIHEHPNDAKRVMTGTQDNGMAGTATGSLVWPQLTAGDGGYGVYLNEVYTTLFTTYVYLRVYRKTGNTTTDISGPWSNDSREWIAPLVADLNGGTTIYGGTNRVWRNLSSLSGGSATWTRARTNDGTRIAAISTRPGDPLTAVIVRNASSGVRVLRTLNALNWTSLTGTMPTGVTAKALAVDWDRGVPTLFVGSGAGVYTSFNAGAAWTKSGPDLPNVNIGQLEINRARRTIAVGTYGRGAWRSALPRPADLDLNGAIDASDLSILLGGWGVCGDRLNCPADIDANGIVDGADLTLLLSSWGS